MRPKRGAVLLCVVALAGGWPSRPGEADPGDAAPNRLEAMTETGATKSEAEIRELIDRAVEAIRGRDLDGVMAVFAPEVVSFDLGPPLQHGGGETFAKRWRALFDAYRGPIDYEVHDLGITAGGDVAFSRSLNRVRGTTKDGRKSDRWLRWTACYRRIDGRWRIVHEHVSVPVDLEHGKALLALKP